MKSVIFTIACILSFQTYAATTNFQGFINPKLDIKLSYSVYATSGLKSCYDKVLGIFAITHKKETLHFEIDRSEDNTYFADLDENKFEALTNGRCQYRIYDRSAVISDGTNSSRVYVIGSSPIDCTYVGKKLICEQQDMEFDNGQLNINLK